MARPKIDTEKQRVKGGYSISPEVNLLLEQFVLENMVVKSRVIEKAIKEFLERENEKKRV